MTWGKTANRRPRDPHAGLITALTVITTLGIAARLLAPTQDALASAPQADPVRVSWFSLSFEDVPQDAVKTQ